MLRPFNLQPIFAGECEEFPHKFRSELFSSFIFRGCKYQDRIRRRDRLQHGLEGDEGQSVPHGGVPRIDAWDVDDAWLVPLDFSEKAYNDLLHGLH